VFGFCMALTLTTVGIGMSVTVVGVFLLAFAVVFGRWLGMLDRAVLNGLLDARIETPRRFKTTRTGLLGRLGARLTDGVGWRGLAHQVLRFPLAVATFSSPWRLLGVHAGRDDVLDLVPLPPEQQLGWTAGCTAARALWNTTTSGYYRHHAAPGWSPRDRLRAVSLAHPWIVHGFVLLQRMLGRALLGPSRSRSGCASWSRPAARRSPPRTSSCAGSSGTCTTALRPGSSRWR
jgi:hypothetical protein